MILFTEDERRFLFSLMNDQYQNWNYRSVEGDLLKSILDSLSSVTVAFNEKQNRRCQWLIRDLAELYVRQADPRLQHRLQSGPGPGSGLGATAVINPDGSPLSGGGSSIYFDGAAMYNRCQAILAKLEGDVGS